jgi:glycine betaine/proline transport system ATP-binding protein
MSSTVASSCNAVAETPVKVKLSCKNVWKIFGERVDRLFSADGVVDRVALESGDYVNAVQDANFDVHENEIFVIMGLSGSGKSTLLRCMTRLIEPSAGSIIFESDDLLKASEKELIELRRHKMGMVFQHFALLPNRTVLGNVELPLQMHGLAKAERQKRAMKVIELVGLDGREEYFPRELSGGQQQRVGIARSLVAEPEVWFLDEPFSALDPLIRKEMQDEFIRLQSVLSKTIVFITHDFDEAIRLADRIAIMKDGAIIQIGTPEQLVLEPADDYVKEFIQDIPRAKVLSAASLMTSKVSNNFAGSLLATTKIDELLGTILNADRDDVFAVENSTGVVVGELHRQVVVDLLSSTNP